MTVPSTTRKAGPYSGNGSTTAFSFSFKTSATSEIAVVKTSTLGVESTLVLNSDYTVTLNGNQTTTPGGSITCTVAPATGEKITITGNVAYSQTASLPNGGAYNAAVVEAALDRITILTQQLKEELSRAVKVNVSDPTDPSGIIASLNAAAAAAAASASAASASATSSAASYDSFDDRYLGPKASDPTLDNDGNALLTGALYWNTTSTSMKVYSGLSWGDVAATVSTPYQTFSGNGSTTGFTLSGAPGSLGSVEVFISGVRQAPATDYTVSGTTLTFTSAPPTGTSNIFVRWIATQAIGVPSDGSVTVAKLASDATTLIDNLKDVAANSQSGSYTLVLGDRGKSIDYTGAGGHTFTIPANASVAFPVGTVITMSNTTVNNVSIAITTDTLRLAGTATTGTRTLGQYGVATMRKVASTTWIISGSGLS